MISEIVINRQEGAGRYVRIRHTDITGKKHLSRHGVLLDADLDVLLVESGDKLSNQLIEQEYNQYISLIKNGVNPFRDAENTPIDPVFLDRNTMLSRVLIKVVSSTDATLFMSGAPYLANLSDAELITLMSITQEIVNDIRAKVIAISDTATFLSSYTPPITGGE